MSEATEEQKQLELLGEVIKLPYEVNRERLNYLMQKGAGMSETERSEFVVLAGWEVANLQEGQTLLFKILNKFKRRPRQLRRLLQQIEKEQMFAAVAGKIQEFVGKKVKSLAETITEQLEKKDPHPLWVLAAFIGKLFGWSLVAFIAIVTGFFTLFAGTLVWLLGMMGIQLPFDLVLIFELLREFIVRFIPGY